MRIDKRGFIIKSENLNFSGQPLLVRSEGKKDSVRINLKKEGEVVRIIEIFCSCGNKIELLCQYENEASSQD